MWFALALALGRSVKQTQREIDSAEFAEWIAYSRISPFGDVRADMRAAQIVATLLNLQRKRSQPYTVAEVMLQFEPRPVMHWREQQANFRILAEMSKRS